MILDAPVVFTNADGTLYEPLNYKGEWHGRVLLRDALAESMNVPSLKVLDGIGFDAAIQRAARLLGVSDPAEIDKRFPRYYPLGLGIISSLRSRWRARTRHSRTAAGKWSPCPSATSRTATEKSSWSLPRKPSRRRVAKATAPRS